MELVFEKITQTLAAGQRWPSQIAGNFFRLSVAQYPVSVSIIKDFRVIGTMQNMLAGDYVKDIEFDGVVVINGATAQDVTIQIAGGGAGSDRVLGEVSVIDGSKARTIAGSAVMLRSSSVGLAGQYPHSQIWNPAGSGKNIIVDGVMASLNSSGAITVGYNSTQLATAGFPFSSKLLGAAVTGVAVSRIESNVGILITNALGSFYVPANQGFDLKGVLGSPLVIRPGYGLVIVGELLASSLTTSISLFEEPV